MRSDLPPYILETKTERVQGQSLISLPLVEAKRCAIEEVERNYLLTLLKECRGNVTQIAKRSQMTRRNLHRLLKKHGLDPSSWRIKNEN